MSGANAQPPTAAELAEWSTRAARGDEEALVLLLSSHHARLLGFATRKVGVDWAGKIDPEDLLQEAYIDICAAIGDFTCAGEDAFYRWAARIIDHRFIDQVRHWRRRKRDTARETRPAGTTGAGLQTLLERCGPQLGSPSVALRRADAVAAIMSGLACLPPDYRQVIQRLYLRQEPLAAVAADLGRSEDATRRLAGRALERLGAHLGRASRYLSSHG